MFRNVAYLHRADVDGCNCCALTVLGLAGMIARDLDLMRGGKRYIKTAAYGHFGRDDPDFTWEKVKKLEA